MEKRRFPRLAKCLPLEYSYRLPRSEEICSGKGFSQDLSLGGIYFKWEASRLDCGLRIDLTITEIIHQPIVRLEPPQDQALSYGVAVQFLRPMDLFGGASLFGKRPQQEASSAIPRLPC